MNPMFEAIHLHKRFGDQVVLEDITLSFEANRVSGIMGPNGAGKTTCFNVLTGHFKPNRGKVIFDGEDITGLPERAIARKGISRSFQLMNVFDDYTVLENIQVALPDVRSRSFNLFKSLPADSSIRDKAHQVLKQVGLSEFAGQEAKDLSYGNRRVLEIGIALAADPKLLFLDEPTQGLGSDQISQLSNLIQKLREDVTIVIIEHDMPFLFGLADEISVIHWGQVIRQGTPDELRENKWVKASNLGKFE
ncbi:MAG: ABC transporter ATP-binding protein [Planctomycetota bacterium]|nr:ABC transporter ATP-binding protein [Planctomycetota bacterium]